MNNVRPAQLPSRLLPKEQLPLPLRLNILLPMKPMALHSQLNTLLRFPQLARLSKKSDTMMLLPQLTVPLTLQARCSEWDIVPH
jgi:hypothetical protein